MQSVVEKLQIDSSQEEMLIAQVVAPNYAKKLLYITKRAYLQAGVWPLSLLSLGLIAPKKFNVDVITLFPFCPNVITPEFEAARFKRLNRQFPHRTGTSLVELEKDGSFSEYSFSKFGQYRQNRIDAT